MGNSVLTVAKWQRHYIGIIRQSVIYWTIELFHGGWLFEKEEANESHTSYMLINSCRRQGSRLQKLRCRVMGEYKEITDKLAMQILDKEIAKCGKALQALEIGTVDFDNVYMEMRSYQMHRNTLLGDGGANDR